jgi:Family of unknown function (DUF6325)
VFITKDDEGNVAALELEDLPGEHAASLTAVAVPSGMLNEEDIDLVGGGLENNSSGLLMLFENVWAARLTEAVRNADGELIANERIPHDIVEAARADLAANPD